LAPKLKEEMNCTHTIFTIICTKTIDIDILAADIKVFWIRWEMIFHMQLQHEIIIK